MTSPDSHDDAHHDHGASGCEEALEELYLYLDGELTAERRVTIRTHLEDCSPCFEAFDFEAELRMVISHRCKEQVPESFRARIAQLLQAGADDASGPDRRA